MCWGWVGINVIDNVILILNFLKQDSEKAWNEVIILQSR